jgi:hypothetical protein
LTAGTYYVSIGRESGARKLSASDYEWEYGNGNYQFTMYFTPVVDDDYHYYSNNVLRDKNNTIAKATPISQGTKAKVAQLAMNGDEDVYRIYSGKASATLKIILKQRNLSALSSRRMKRL